MIDRQQLEDTLDLWQCMWSEVEQLAFETALVRAMTDEHARGTRLHAFAVCNVIGTPRLMAAAVRMAERGLFAPDEISQIELLTLPLFKLHEGATRLRGNLVVVEHMLTCFVDGRSLDSDDDHLLDWVDVRDLVTIAWTTLDARLFREIELRVALRGKYQRGRAARALGFRVKRPGHSSSASPVFGELGI